MGHQLDHQLDHQWAVIEGGLAELQKALTADDLADIGGEVHLARPRQYPQHVDFQCFTKGQSEVAYTFAA